jgi:diadenosine tetraphosphate (Ap4A) HIT family hydrolase
MMESLPTPPKEAILFEDGRLYVCLASFPITRGHTVVVWKHRTEDLHLLTREEYEYLMDIVDAARNALLSALSVEKVYLMYMDEIKQVHWHLVPRYDEQGVNMLAHTPVETTDFSLADSIRATFRSPI